VGGAKRQKVGVRVVVPSILVSAEDVDDFDAAIAFARILRWEQRLEHTLPHEPNIKGFAVPDYFYRSDGCLVISFDGGWYPFLDNTRGLQQRATTLVHTKD